MNLKDFYFDLPEELIAKYPSPKRRDCRLLELNGHSGELFDKTFSDVVDEISEHDLLIFNNTKVIPARVYGYKESGGKIEILVERLLDEYRALAHIRSSKSPKPGTKLLLCQNNSSTHLDLNTAKENPSCIFEVIMTKRHDTLFEINSGNTPILTILNTIGHMPLPPYINRADEISDKERYQTVYAKTEGAVAAPTAGLHFDEELIESIKSKGAQIAYVTLHVGAGTFQPVRVENILDHQMHSEYAVVSAETVEAIKMCKRQGGRVIAVGTTSMRSLESAALASLPNSLTEIDKRTVEFDVEALNSFQNDTNIFIYPGYTFKLVDTLITNFHLPESTLIMLVSAFAGYEHTMNAYEHAIKNKYQFFSYGDAMLIKKYN
ncbi:tRNA preQ1(34) S-adenosylmethionine ribosyltransferase-isomerase QueA [Thorsellia kenyensis]|uniref:S-adenosylmethionine:tRNA ribosyltransferase-isomerase n=1 Tax=Thorsellia kenyensis TaxID=1549888 RepID=A0ABV6C8W9_9GAMM